MDRATAHRHHRRHTDVPASIRLEIVESRPDTYRHQFGQRRRSAGMTYAVISLSTALSYDFYR